MKLVTFSFGKFKKQFCILSLLSVDVLFLIRLGMRRVVECRLKICLGLPQEINWSQAKSLKIVHQTIESCNQKTKIL